MPLRVIDGQNDRSHWRFLDGTAEYWVCPQCRARGDGDHMATMKITPFTELLPKGRMREAKEIKACINCYLKHGKITEV